MFTVNLTNVTLVLWEARKMPERTYNPEIKEWVKTGRDVEMTLYTLRDDEGETLKFLSSDNGYRQFEGSDVEVVIGLEFDDYRNTMKTPKLVGIAQLAS